MEGVAIIRLASLGGLPVTGLADRFGLRMMLLVTVGAGLALTALAAASPSFALALVPLALLPLLRRWIAEPGRFAVGVLAMRPATMPIASVTEF